MFINLLSFYMHTCMFPVLYIPAGFPIEWKRSEKQFELVRVYNTSREYRKVKSHFCNTLPKATVIQIERIQNTVLWRKYHRKMADLKSDPQLPTGGEKLLFHGTRNTNPSDVFMGDAGFDMRFSRDGMWGKGNYFAENAVYSHNFCHTEKGQHKMLVAKVLTGACYNCQIPQKYSVPPLRQTTGQEEGEVQKRYDSIRGFSRGSVIYITYDNDHAYPAYLLTYTLP